jgi:hypothetical protein
MKKVAPYLGALFLIGCLAGSSEADRVAQIGWLIIAACVGLVLVAAIIAVLIDRINR